jgi:hypothetical protein
MILLLNNNLKFLNSFLGVADPWLGQFIFLVTLDASWQSADLQSFRICTKDEVISWRTETTSSNGLVVTQQTDQSHLINTRINRRLDIAYYLHSLFFFWCDRGLCVVLFSDWPLFFFLYHHLMKFIKFLSLSWSLGHSERICHLGRVFCGPRGVKSHRLHLWLDINRSEFRFEHWTFNPTRVHRDVEFTEVVLNELGLTFDADQIFY